MKRGNGIALLSLLAFFVAAGLAAAQIGEDYIITYEPSVNVRPCPRFTEECNAIYRLPAGTVLLGGVAVQGDSFGGSTAWLRFEREGREIFIHSSLLRPAPPNSDLADAEQAHAWVALFNESDGEQRSAAASVILDLRVGANQLHVYVRGVDCRNRVRIFENVSTALDCGRPGEVWYLENIDRIHFIIDRQDDDDPEIELRCGRHNDSDDGQLIFACVYEEELRSEVSVSRPSGTTPTPDTASSRAEDCADFEYHGSESQRFQIFEGWLVCAHGLDDDGYHALPDDESRSAIWWEFVELACGSDTSSLYWIIDFDDDWRCVQKAWPATPSATPTPTQAIVCDEFEYPGTENQRKSVFYEWLACEHDLRGVDEFNAISDDERRSAIWWDFVELACGSDTSSLYWIIDFDDDWRCQRKAWSATASPTPRPASATPTPSATPDYGRLPCEQLTFPRNGAVNSRRGVFERWLACHHDLRRNEFENLSDVDSMFDIWWRFVEFACGLDSYPKYWIIGVDWRCVEQSWLREEVNRPPCGPIHFVGAAPERARIFENWLSCEFGISAEQYFELHSTFAEPIYWAFLTAACGEDTATYDWHIDDSWSCARRDNRTGELLPSFTPTPRPTRTPQATATPICGPAPLAGSVVQRISIFDRWLNCKHQLDYDRFRELPVASKEDIWWDFVIRTCGEDTASYYWDIDRNAWECEQRPWDRASECKPAELTGTRVNRLLIFEQWLLCEYDMDMTTYLRTLNESTQDDILQRFVSLACGPDTEDYYWYLEEDLTCQKNRRRDGRSA